MTSYIDIDIDIDSRRLLVPLMYIDISVTLRQSVFGPNTRPPNTPLTFGTKRNQYSYLWYPFLSFHAWHFCSFFHFFFRQSGLTASGLPAHCPQFH